VVDGLTGEFSGLEVAVVGTGLSGRAAAAALLRLGAAPWIVDTRPAEAIPEAAREALSGADFPVLYADPSSLARASLAVLSPGVSIRDPFLGEALAAGVEVIGEVELAARARPKARIVGITGTNGKSTSTALTGALLAAAGRRCVVCGNIGSPLVTHVIEREDAPIFVTELSSFQLETVTRFHAVAATILNVTDDHRDRHPRFEEYVAVKARIFDNQEPADAAVLNAACPPLAALGLSLIDRRLLCFSSLGEVDRGGYLRGDTLWLRLDGTAEAICGRADMRLQGMHNVENVLAAACLAGSLGLSVGEMRKAAVEFIPAAHTYRTVGSANGVRYVNDSKGTNVDSTLRALDGCTAPTILIAGGASKDADYTPLGPAIARRCTALLTIGQTGPDVASAARAVGFGAIEECDTLEQAVLRSSELARPGDVVLLSPASASFGLFRDYKHRGEAFEEAVRGLPGFAPAAWGNEDETRQ